MDITAFEVIDVLLMAATAVLYGYVGLVVSYRRVSKAAAMANKSFGTWWWMLATITIMGVVWTVIHWFVPQNLPLYMAYLHLVLMLIMAAFGGLLYYFLYLYSGRQNLWIAATAYYFSLFILFVYYIWLQEPIGFDELGDVVYANDLSDSTFSNVFAVLFLVPTILGAMLYLSLIRRVRDRILRFRIGVVAFTIIGWFTISLGSGFGNVSTTYDWWVYVSRGISLLAAGLTLMAFRPSARIRRWFRLDEPARSDR